VRDLPSAIVWVDEDDDHPRFDPGRVDRLDDSQGAGRVDRRHAVRLDRLEAPAEEERRPEQDRQGNQERDAERTVHPLAPSRPVDLFELRRRYAFLAPLFDAEYGSASFVPVNGDAELQRVLRATEALFGGGDLRGVGGDLLDDALAAAPSITVPRSRFEGEGALIVDLLVEVGACPSKSDARRQLGAGGVAVNGVPLGTSSVGTRVTTQDLIDGRLLVLRRGKRNNYVIRVA
jgi:hypothetical protein